MLAEIEFRGGGEAIVAVSKIDLIGVHGEDLRLGVAAFDLQGQEHLLDLAAEAAVTAVEEEVARELHGDGAGAFGAATLQNVAIGRAGYAGKIDAPVIFKMLVFDRQDGVVKNFGALLVGHQDAPLKREAAHELAVIGVDLGGRRIIKKNHNTYTMQYDVVQ